MYKGVKYSEQRNFIYSEYSPIEESETNCERELLKKEPVQSDWKTGDYSLKLMNFTCVCVKSVSLQNKNQHVDWERDLDILNNVYDRVCFRNV